MNKFLVPCFGLVVLLSVGFVTPTRLAAGDSNRDCYPGNTFNFASGETWAKGEAEGNVGEIETTRIAVSTNRGPAEIEIEFEAKIDDSGNSKGTAKLTVHWLDKSKTGGIEETTFESGCVVEVETDHQTGISIGEFEGEFEGAVENFPGYKGTTKAAVLSIVAHQDDILAGRAQLDFSLELGYTCFENVYTGFGDIEFEKVSLTNLNPAHFHINNVGHHGQVSFPDEQTVSSCGF